MILVWGVPNDGPVRAVCAELQRTGEPALLLDQFDVARSDVSFNVDDPTVGVLTAGGERIDFAALTAVYLRPYESERVLRAAGVCEQSAIEHAARFDDAMLLWMELTQALIVNRPSAMASNSSKPLQSALIAEAGFATPCTLLTTVPEAAAAFRARHGRVIYKSTGGIRSRVSVLDDAALQRIGTAACPLQLQEHVGGTDIRVHVVGDAVFACAIRIQCC
jgi:hypothetical protein